MTWTPWHVIVMAIADKKPSWGYGHIHGEVKGLGYDVSWQTVRRIMHWRY